MGRGMGGVGGGKKSCLGREKCGRVYGVSGEVSLHVGEGCGEKNGGGVGKCGERNGGGVKK